MALPTPLPALDEVLAAASCFSRPLRTRFRGVIERNGVWLSGPQGIGEFAPFDDYDDQSAARWLSAALEAGWGVLPSAIRSEIPVNLIVPATSPALAADIVRDLAAETGCTTVKVKVAEPGTDVSADIERVRAVRSALDDVFGRGLGRIRVDANGAWSITAAAEALAVLDDIAGGLEYAEQPCASLSEIATLREKTAVAIAVDEGLRRAFDPQEAVDEIRASADIVIIKPIPLGGVDESLRLAQLVGLPVVVSGSLDTSIGLLSSLRTAAALPELPLACGLGTGPLFTSEEIRPRRGVLPVAYDIDVQDALPLSQAWCERIEHAYRHVS